jgi:hypothetical protein
LLIRRPTLTLLSSDRRKVWRPSIPLLLARHFIRRPSISLLSDRLFIRRASILLFTRGPSITSLLVWLRLDQFLGLVLVLRRSSRFLLGRQFRFGCSRLSASRLTFWWGAIGLVGLRVTLWSLRSTMILGLLILVSRVISSWGRGSFW